MQLYDEEVGEFLADRYVTGTCPHCGKDGAYGDQCEACGTSLSPTDLVNPKSALSGSVPVMKETKHWYLPSTSGSPRFASGFLRTTRSGAPMSTASASHGSTWAFSREPLAATSNGESPCPWREPKGRCFMCGLTRL